MTKQDVISQVSKRTGLDPLVSRSIIESFFEVVKDALTQGEPIYVRQFGSFTLKQRAQKKGRNISQNTTVVIAAHAIPYFKPSGEFTDQVRAQEVPASVEKTKSKPSRKSSNTPSHT